MFYFWLAEQKRMASQTEENYLKALFFIANKKGEVNISELSNVLKVSPPTANSMVKNLKSKQLVNYEKYKPLSLTAKGKREAARVIRKHRLTEMYLVEKMGFGWEEVHDIAEQIEHIDSPEFFERMDDLLGYPKFDPHGSPIPDKFGHMEEAPYTHLSHCQVGDEVKLTALAHSSSEFLRFLNSRDLILGTKIKINAVEPFDGSIVIKYKGHPTETLSRSVAEKLMVEHSSKKNRQPV